MAYGVGAALRQERLRQNVALDKIASQTRISSRFLTAIEDENFGQLPGLLFTRNFVRQYALALELDPDPLLAQLPKVDNGDSAASAAGAPSRDRRWDPRWNAAISLTAWLLLAVSAVVAAYVYFSRPAPRRAQLSAPIEQLQRGSLAVPVAMPVLTHAVAGAPPAHPVEVVLTAREQAWVQVTADGKIAFTATLQANESRSVSADDQVKVVTGNAGGVAISLNGRLLEPMGPAGQVRTLKLTAAGPQPNQKIPPPPQPL